jgi:hypothetical protein
MKRSTVAFLLCLFTIGLPLSAAQLEPGDLACSDCSPVSGDFNGDGLDDLLSKNRIFFNLGDGFGPGIASTGIEANDAINVAGDFNHDGLTDAIVHRRSSSTGVGQPSTANGSDWLLINRGSGRFVTGDPLPAGRVVQAADFSGDGRPDLILFRSEGHVLARGNGAGSFAVQQVLPYPDGTRSTLSENPFAVGDLNRDALPDLVLPRGAYLYFYFANADGTYGEPVKRYTHLTARHPQIADVNGDNRADLVFNASLYHGSRVTVLYGNGTGRFPRVAHLTVPGETRRGMPAALENLAVADFYAGGSNEIAVGVASGYAVVLSAMGDKLTEVARVDVPKLLNTKVYAGRFRSGSGVDLYLVGIDVYHSDAQLVFADGSIDMPVAAQTARRISRSRASGRMIRDPQFGEYEVTVDGACSAHLGGRWRFEREGLFVHVTGVPGLERVEAVAIDDDVFVRLFIQDLGKTRVLEGSVFSKWSPSLRGTLTELAPPCGGEWAVHTVTGTRR